MLNNLQSNSQSSSSSPHFCSFAPQSSMSSSIQRNSFLIKQQIDEGIYQSMKSKKQMNDSILIQDKQNIPVLNNNYERQTKRCCNHKDQKAQYCITSQQVQELTYCRKCASRLIKQGFEVDLLKIPQLNIKPQPHKQQNLNKIKEQFSLLKQQVLNKKRQTEFCLIQSQTIFHYQIEQINQYFTELHLYLDQLKNKFYNAVLDEKQNVLKKNEEWNDILEQMVAELESIQQDIVQNKHKIVQINDEQYHDLSQSLNQHLVQYNRIVDSWNINYIQPQSIYLPQITEAISQIKALFQPNIIPTYRSSTSKYTTPRQSHRNTLPQQKLFNKTCHNVGKYF